MSRSISVIVPCFNGERYIDAALRSIALQEEAILQIVVIDAGSSDRSQQIIEDHQRRDDKIIRIVAPTATPPSVARNMGLAAAHGNYVAFLDADDLWPQGKLRRQLLRLEQEPRLGMVSGYVRYFEQPDAKGLAPLPGSRTTDIIHVHLGACVYRQEVLRELGGFDPELRFAEDVDLLQRVRESRIPFRFLRSIELYYRRHPAAMTAREKPRQASDFRKAALKSVRRRRAMGESEPLPELAALVDD